MILRQTRRQMLAAGAALVVAPGGARAQGFPSKPVKIVVPYPPGGPTDGLARIVAEDIRADLGQNVIVENMAGASGAIGTRAVARAEADGHTIVFGTNQTHCTNAFLLKEPGYDPVKDFAPLAALADLQHVLVLKKDLAAATGPDLAALARKEPGKLNYGSTGLGSGSHLAMELFRARTGTEMQHIPFPGAAPMAQEIMAGRIDAAMATLPSVLGMIQGGQMKAAALASATPAPQLADVKLLRDQGITDAEADAWLAFFAPAAIPAAVRDRLAGAILASMRKPEVKERATKLGFAVNLKDSGQLAAFQATEMKKWTAVAQAAGLKAQ
ncbi:MAG TPA: tripartite tricarboxylate transporter substrate binding protein [Beijerinckiaceae bacterium]|nr:tripartite tricarboxylate transporter substrate binding protein [Beijerinckiaceae bacterium]